MAAWGTAIRTCNKRRNSSGWAVLLKKKYTKVSQKEINSIYEAFQCIHRVFCGIVEYSSQGLDGGRVLPLAKAVSHIMTE